MEYVSMAAFATPWIIEASESVTQNFTINYKTGL
jgi:hypothetical protein